jgi:hypothetical protein
MMAKKRMIEGETVKGEERRKVRTERIRGAENYE